MSQLRLVPRSEGGEPAYSEADHARLALKRVELKSLDSNSVLAVCEPGDEANQNVPLNMIRANLEDFLNADMAPPAIVLKELLATLASRGFTLTEQQMLALNNFVARKQWNMPRGGGSFLVRRELPEMESLNEQVERRRDQLLREHLGGLAKIVDDLANRITIHWNDAHTETLDALKVRAKKQAVETARKEGLGGLAFLRSLAGLDSIRLDESEGGNVVSLKDRRLQRDASAPDGPHQAALGRFREMLRDGSYMMSYVAVNDKDAMIRDAARCEIRARRFINQEVAQAAIAFWKEFIKKEVADLQFEV